MYFQPIFQWFMMVLIKYKLYILLYKKMCVFIYSNNSLSYSFQLKLTCWVSRVNIWLLWKTKCFFFVVVFFFPCLKTCHLLNLLQLLWKLPCPRFVVLTDSMQVGLSCFPVIKVNTSTPFCVITKVPVWAPLTWHKLYSNIKLLA